MFSATKALDAAIASADAKAIRAAMDALDDAARGRSAAPASTPALAATPAVAPVAPAAAKEPAEASGDTPPKASSEASVSEKNEAPAQSESAQTATETVADQGGDVQGDAPTEAAAAPAQPPKAAPKPVVARRGDDRPGAKLGAPAKAEAGRFGDKRGGDRRDGKFGDKKPGFGDRRPDSRPDARGDARPDRAAGFGSRDGAPRGAGRDERFEDRGPRLSNTAFYALRDGMDKAQLALKKLAAQAHGESVVSLLSAWEARNPENLPSAQQLGRSLQPAARAQWAQALAKPASGDAAQALLRLEMAAEVPTPAEQIDARRMLQLQLLTKRGEAGPKDTWAGDAATVLASAHDEQNARRLQNALKALLR